MLSRNRKEPCICAGSPFLRRVHTGSGLCPSGAAVAGGFGGDHQRGYPCDFARKVAGSRFLPPRSRAGHTGADDHDLSRGTPMQLRTYPARRDVGEGGVRFRRKGGNGTTATRSRVMAPRVIAATSRPRFRGRAKDCRGGSCLDAAGIRVPAPSRQRPIGPLDPGLPALRLPARVIVQPSYWQAGTGRNAHIRGKGIPLMEKSAGIRS